ncbi:MAG: DUF1592 domain-containing protein [Pirellulaceae bacterium]|nr:DUF1592 domain-containing protein [Pirellulaceae bacterium]
MNMLQPPVKLLGFLVLIMCWQSTAVFSLAQADDALLQRELVDQVQPLLKQLCYECHSGDSAEAEIDLAQFPSLASVRTQVKTWQKVLEVLKTGDMPPPESPAPSDVQREQMRRWIERMLSHEALSQAGDPGPVGLRRLDNAQYSYVIQDITGLPDLDPTAEFPMDGAAGEGFTNVASGQGMSPALVQKYLDAAKQIAHHLVLLPRGVRFSRYTTRRDQTDELLAGIQQFYRQFTADGGGTAVDLQGIKFETNQDGLLPLDRYLGAAIEAREALRSGQIQPVDVASQHKLNLRYFTTLWQVLENEPTTQDDQASDRLLAEFRRQWLTCEPEQLPALVERFAAAQRWLWKYNPVGQVGRQGGPARWMEPITPLASQQVVRLPLRQFLPAADSQNSLVPVWLVAHDLADGNSGDWIVLEQPRLEFATAEGRSPVPSLPLQQVQQVTQQVKRLLASELPRTAKYLSALQFSRDRRASLREVAQSERLNLELLQNWSRLTGVASDQNREITGHFTQKQTRLHGYEGFNGWGSEQTPSLLSNSTAQSISIATLTIPARSVTVHPSPTHEAFVAWRSPVSGPITVSGLLADADSNCGNGIAWRVEHRSASQFSVLSAGNLENGKRHELHLEQPLKVAVGDVLVLSVGPHAGDHICDTTEIQWKMHLSDSADESWDLSSEIVDIISNGNPLPDHRGNADVWHFGSTPINQHVGTQVPADSLLGRWVAAATSGQESLTLATEVGQQLSTGRADQLAGSDQQITHSLLDWRGPLNWIAVARAQIGPSDATDLPLRAPQALEYSIPAEFCEVAELVTTVKLDQRSHPQASVQFQVHSSPPQQPTMSTDAPLLVHPGSTAERSWSESCRRFRELFPPALCYSRIVPVDEVVTLTLFYREDQLLEHLMLDQSQVAELNGLWDELYFVSQEPLQLVVALEQLIQFATQDRQDLVGPFQGMQASVGQRAESFRQQQLNAEPSHLSAVIDLAEKFWRRPLSKSEHQQLTQLYMSLRDSEISHEEALRLVLVRVLTSPDFLYKLEHVPEGATPVAVTARELANRLSFFLWSSIADQPLLTAVADGSIVRDEELARQTQRMLQAPATKRLAIHFACQWLHVRDFATSNDKNERLFPQFAQLRQSMADETVLFFEDLFRNDRSILDILGAEHTYVDPALAEHYGLQWPAHSASASGGTRQPIGNDQWRRIDTIRGAGRGGVLGMAAILASQSGASRSSPILRGNWVYETVLGERLPKPPPGVPVLPEEAPEGLTERQLIEQHSSVQACARCHVKIDPYGFALEQFDAIGHQRPISVDTATRLADGQAIQGLPGLRDYLLNQRRHDFLRNFCRKLLGYALGREVQLSDQPLVDEMVAQLPKDDYRFSSAVTRIVTSPQFRNIRGADFGTTDH